MLGRIGSGLDHCIQELGAGTEQLQAAGAPNGLLVQYRDTTGMPKGVRRDLDVAAAERVFVAVASFLWPYQPPSR